VGHGGGFFCGGFFGGKSKPLLGKKERNPIEGVQKGEKNQKQWVAKIRKKKGGENRRNPKRE